MNPISLLSLVPGFGQLAKYLAFAKNIRPTLDAAKKALQDIEDGVASAVAGTPAATSSAITTVNAALEAGKRALQSIEDQLAQLGVA